VKASCWPAPPSSRNIARAWQRIAGFALGLSKGAFELIRRRLEARKNHYMKAGLLESQFAALEEPQDAIVAEVGPEPEVIADFVLRQLQVSAPRKTGSTI
jgi:gluconate kinase